MPQDAPLTLLIVDDDTTDVSLLRDQLGLVHRSPPFRVEAVGRLADALKRVKGDDVDVVLLDLGLPDSVGLNAVDRLCTHAPHLEGARG